MALIDVDARLIRAKIVYYGPGLGGKTTNLKALHDRLPDDARSELVSIDTEGERTLFFDLLPLDLGTVQGYSFRFQLYTVPGQTRYSKTRLAVLNGADGVVFVADARASAREENRRSLDELTAALRGQGHAPETFPVVLQYNKTDLPDALPQAELDSLLNAGQRTRFPAVANQGIGVFETLSAICRLVVRNL
jgi:signal recognition particle receptor subunit beta